MKIPLEMAQSKVYNKTVNFMMFGRRYIGKIYG